MPSRRLQRRRVQNNDGGKRTNFEVISGALINGGGIWNGGTLTINRSTLNGNGAYCTGRGCESNGGGVASQGTLTVNNSTISGNTAQGVNRMPQLSSSFSLAENECRKNSSVLTRFVKVMDAHPASASSGQFHETQIGHRRQPARYNYLCFLGL